ncbi:MAG: hypothetical protein ABEJ98_02655 [Candidatus Nanohaloarchaea archaeon]
MSDWSVFQRDVLDVLHQYNGFFDFFERVGSLSDDSRPDCFARITRENKKEIWVLDAKNKPEIDGEDLERMEKYIEQTRSNPVDVGLEISEISDYRFRGIFITNGGADSKEDFEVVQLRSLHQFLQKELVYTDMDRVVRDLSKMAERKQLSQSQARILSRSLEPFRKRVKRCMKELERIEKRHTGIELKKPPLSVYDFKVPVDAVMTHENRDKALLFDIPYSYEAVKEVEEKVEEVKTQLDDMGKEVYYAAVNTFKQHSSDYVIQPGEVEKEVRETLGIVSRYEVADMFEPKVRTEREISENAVVVEDRHDLGFKLKVFTRNDTEYQVEAVLPEEAASRVKNAMLNSMKEFGEVTENGFRHSFQVGPDLKISHGGGEESFHEYRDTVKSVFQSSVSPVLGKSVRVDAEHEI